MKDKNKLFQLFKSRTGSTICVPPVVKDPVTIGFPDRSGRIQGGRSV